MRVALIGSASNDASAELVRSWCELGLDASLMGARQALAELGSGDVALARLDVRQTLDGVEPGLLDVLRLERLGVVDLRNPVEALLNMHDKLRTARLLTRAGLPHPATAHVRRAGRAAAGLRPPFVVKPRFGSWGSDVVLCTDAAAVRGRITELRNRPWFSRHGALVQEAIPNAGTDLRVIVAGGRVIGAAERVAAAGEWRTNVSCGGSLRPARGSDAAFELARAAVAVVGADFAGVDLLPLGGDRYVVLELNAAVDFDRTYSFSGDDVFEAAAVALRLVPSRVLTAAR